VWLKILIVVIFLGILISLGSGLFHLVYGKGNDKSVVKALSFRVGLSLGLFLLLMALIGFGVIKPHGLYPEGHEPNQQNASEQQQDQAS